MTRRAATARERQAREKEAKPKPYLEVHVTIRERLSPARLKYVQNAVSYLAKDVAPGMSNSLLIALEFPVKPKREVSAYRRAILAGAGQ